ncbi:virion structural protein [Acidovorax phage ACP17]|uniref:Uncharacterized protein n=1 Tax=Acidovorax phage ACP17 TaxID=2010329 RepID=A0A218M2U7_9CAUD|nr:virion structural protein [Acidovorax phage ACP17]ASD50361.1 hypothetical protein [Acidovorax phage ACP17]
MTDIRVEDRAGLVKRDSAYIVNTDRDEYARALARRTQSAKNKKLEKRVEDLEGKLDEIIHLLRGINGN